MKKKLSIIFVGILFLLPINGFSGNVIVVDAQRQFQLAQTLFSEKEFLAAANEYIRFYHLFPNHENVALAGYKTGVCFFYAGRFQDAIRHLEKISGDFSDDGFAPDAMFKLSEVYAAMEKPGRAVAVLRGLITLTGNTPVRDRACFILGWLLLDNVHELKSQSDYKIDPVKEAENFFSMISPQGKKEYRIEESIASLKKRHLVKKKSPATAGALSVVPGGGFLYCERYRDALVSFLLNSSLILAAYHSFENDNDFLGGVISFVEAGFYTGNIYGSVSSAHKYNRNKQKKYINKLKQDYLVNENKVSFHPGVIHDGAALMFRYDF